MTLIAEQIKRYLDSKGIIYEYFEANEKRKEAVRVSSRAENKESIAINLIIDEDGNSINIKSFNVAKVPENKLADMYACLNALNAEYRWVKFFIDSDNEVTVSGDAIVDAATVGEEMFEIILRYIGIIDDIYPRLMKVIWG